MEELKHQFVCDNPRVKHLKNKLYEEICDIINSLEYNTEKCNIDCWNGLFKNFKELLEAVESVDKDNIVRDHINLKTLTEKRNKLSRQISALKKANLN